MGNSKIIFGGEVLIDLTADTIKADKLLKGYTAHGADGEPINGSCDFDMNTQDATASAAEILEGKTVGVRGVMVTGTGKNNGAVELRIKTKDQRATIGIGFHDGSGGAEIDETEKAKIIPENIRDGVEILGVTGTMSGTEGAKPQAKTVTPSKSQQTVLPDTGYNYLSQVIVKAIPYEETANAAGGTTVTIG